MKYRIKYTGQFKRDMRLCQRRGYDMQLLHTAISILAEKGTLPAEYRPHVLHGERKDQWECHIQPDWLFIWNQYDDELELLMLNTGTHSDLFGKKSKK